MGTVLIIVLVIVGYLLIQFAKDTISDQKPFKAISFSEKFEVLVEFFSGEYFNNECHMFEPLRTEVRIIGEGMNVNKMVQIYYVRNTLFLEIKIKLWQVEYKQKYQLSDPLLKSYEALLKFSNSSLQDFRQYLTDKAN